MTLQITQQLRETIVNGYDDRTENIIHSYAKTNIITIINPINNYFYRLS